MSVPSEWIVSSLGGNKDEKELSPKVLTSTKTQETTTSVPTHLFLHFDINETILLGDDAGGDSRNESVQKMLAKSAFCQIPKHFEGSPPWEKTKKMEPTHWWDGQEIGRETSMPPLYTGWTWPDHCCPYYRTAYKKYAKSFTEDGNHGKIYGPLLEACEASLSSSRNYSIPSQSSREDDGLSSKSQEHSHNTILPAFYETLSHLVKNHDKQSNGKKVREESQDPPFTVVFRTFGSDLAEIAKVVTSFAKGDHPDYPDIDFPPLCLPMDQLYQGRWEILPEDGGNSSNADKAAVTPGARAIYQLWTSDESKIVASGDSEILEFLSTKTVLGIRDDYNFWNASRYNPMSGKPIWVPSYHDSKDTDMDGPTSYNHHLFFDDNIHNLPNDGIACIRRESSPNDFSGINANGHSVFYETVDGAAMDEYQGIHLVRVPTVEPVLNPQWYIEQIKKARNRLQHRLQSR